MSSLDREATCRNCGRSFSAANLDPAGWCAGCRGEVVRRATLIARALGGLAAVLTGLWVVMVVQPGSRFVVIWLVLVGAIYFILYKLARRVAFEVIRSRGVRSPDEE